MLVTDFLNSHDILWEPINLSGKTPKRISDYSPDPTDYNLEKSVIIKRQSVPSEYIAIFTNIVQQYDIDINNYSVPDKFKNLPYFESISKKLPHFFCVVDGINKKRNAVVAGDLLCGQWSYCLRKTLVHNYTNNIEKYDIKDFKERINPTKFKNIVKKLKSKIDSYDYDAWMNICFGIYNTAYENVLPNPLEYVTFFSESGKLYDDKAKKFINNLEYKQNGIGVGTLIQYSKSDTESLSSSDEPELNLVDFNGNEIKFFEFIETSYAQFKQEWEKLAFYCINQNKIIYHAYPECLLSSEIKDVSVFYMVGQTKEYGPLMRYGYYNKKKVFVTHISTWLTKEITKLSYFNYDFLPEPFPIKNNTYNLWKGFEKKEYEYDLELFNRAVSIFTEFINHLGNSHPDLPNFLTQYIANIIQKPGFKEGIVLILLGEEGTCKGTFFKLIEGLLGEKYCIQVTDPDKIVGRFNASIMNKLFCCFNEAISYEMINKSGLLKGLSTDTTFSYEDKGKPIVHGHNFTRPIVATNENIGAKSSNSDRRNVHIVTSFMTDKLRNDIYGLIESEHMMYMLFTYLKSLNIIYESQKDWQTSRPRTYKTEEVIEHFIDPIYRVIGKYIEKGKNANVSTKKLYEDYCSIMTRYNKTPKTAREIGIFMTNLNRDTGLCKKIRTSSSRGYIIKKELYDYLLSKNFVRKEIELELVDVVLQTNSYNDMDCMFD